MEHLSSSILQAYTEILREELMPAMGCTEPIAIAYAAAIARHALGTLPSSLSVGLSGNIIKNVKSVIVPATGGLHGIEAALVAGTVAACPQKKLEVLTSLTDDDRETIKALLARMPIKIFEIKGDHAFEIDLHAEHGTDRVHVHLCDRHTNVVLVEKNAENQTDRYALRTCAEKDLPQTDRHLLNVKDIVAFAEETSLDELKPLLQRQIDMNLKIAEEGLQGQYGAGIGRILFNGGSCTLRDRAKAYAAAGSDARMSGCELPVCILSGSGNQGITASLPVVIYAKETGANEETLLRSLIVSDLITIHQKTGIGCLSAYCGAISAGCGSGCGICFMQGGRFYEIAHTLVNSVAILSGTICDGAKASCAAKIAMAVEAGILGFEMMRAGSQFRGGDGIITKGVENTIANIGRLARDGMGETDREIIRMMLEEKK